MVVIWVVVYLLLAPSDNGCVRSGLAAHEELCNCHENGVLIMWGRCDCGDFLLPTFNQRNAGGQKILFNGSVIVAVRYGEKAERSLQTARAAFGLQHPSAGPVRNPCTRGLFVAPHDFSCCIQ